MYTSGRARYSGGAAGGLVQAAGIARGAHGYWVALGPSGPPLPPNSGFGRRIVYSNAEQRIWLVEANGIVSHTFRVSGRHGLPSVGVHQVFSKVTSSPSGDLTLPWTLRFAVSSSGNPIDIHGIPLRPDGSPIEPDYLLGTPQSHGCLRMNPDDAYELGRYLMDHGGQPRDENWFWSIIHSRSETKTVYLDGPIPFLVRP